MPSPRLLDQVRNAIRLRHYSFRTEQAYVDWVKRFIVFSGTRHPRSMGAIDVQRFLSHLAEERNVAAATQAQALSALLFLYKRVLNVDLPWLDGVVRAKRPKRLPTVLTQKEAHRVFANLPDVYWLIGGLLYGGVFVSPRHCGFGSRISNWIVPASWFAMARARRIGSRCCH
jgi:integrase